MSSHYRSPQSGSSSREINPLGLVSKRGVWYLLANSDDGKRTFRVDRVSDVAVVDGKAERPDSFKIDAEWRDVVENVQSIRLTSEVEALVDPEMVWPLRWLFGTSLGILGRAEDDRLHVRLAAHHNEAMAAHIAGFGSTVELLDPPPELTEILGRTGRHLVDRYGSP